MFLINIFLKSNFKIRPTFRYFQIHLIFLNKEIYFKKQSIYLFSLVINLEERQQTTLTEWYSAQENTFKPESQRQRAVPNVTEENDLLDDGGDAVFSQLVRPQWFHTATLSENCVI